MAGRHSLSQPQGYRFKSCCPGKKEDSHSTQSTQGNLPHGLLKSNISMCSRKSDLVGIWGVMSDINGIALQLFSSLWNVDAKETNETSP